MPTGFLGMSHMGQVAAAGWSDTVGPIVAVGMPTPLTKYEPGLNTDWIDQIVTHDLTRLHGCDPVIVSQDVPLNADGTGDELAIRSLIEDALLHIDPGATVVIMSQVSPGFSRSIFVRRLGAEHWGPTFYWVETLVLGQALERFTHPERIIVGCLMPNDLLPRTLSEAWARFQCPILQMKYESAELCKMAINTLLASSITAATTLDMLGRSIGADWEEIMPALRLDKRIGEHAYIRSNPGLIGGQHLIRDLRALEQIGEAHGVDVSFVKHILKEVIPIHA